MSEPHMPNDPAALREELKDRMADLALGEILGGQRPRELSQAVLATSRPQKRSWRGVARLALAASIMVAAGAGAYGWWLSRTDREQVAVVRSAETAKPTSSELGRIKSWMGAKYAAESTPNNQTEGWYWKSSDYTVESAARTLPTVSNPSGRQQDAGMKRWGERNDRFLVAGDGEAQRVEDYQRLGTRVYPVGDLVLPADPASLLGGTAAASGQGQPDLTLMARPRIIVQEEEDNLHVVDLARPDEGHGPGEGGDRYSRIVENPFLKATDNPLSTFSIDVDTASYAKARRYLLQNGMLPPPDAVRIEEFVNYFHYDYAPPKDEKPFAAHVEVAACPWQPKHRLVRIGLKGREIEREARPASNLVFLLDVSGSMEPDDKLPRVQRSMRMLVEQLGENDRVAIVVYAGATGMALPSTPAYRQEEILKALENLQSGGSTNGGAGIRLAYDTAAAHFIKGGTNRVILCTDGDFNVGTTSSAELERLAEEKARTGVFLTVLGFGMGNHNDDMLEKLADKGNGNYGYIDTEEEARKLLVEELSGTLITIAKDVKIQVEFNPRTVGAYRLLGYENRLLRAEDFNDDKKDAGEIGAGHTVTALYEIVPAGEKLDTPPVDPLRYRPAHAPEPDATVSGELLTLKLRYKEPDGHESKEPLIFPVSDGGSQFGQASQDFKFAAAVAGFAMLLRDSQHRGNLTYDAVLEIAQEARGADRHGYRAAFLEVARQAKTIAGK